MVAQSVSEENLQTESLICDHNEMLHLLLMSQCARAWQAVQLALHRLHFTQYCA